MISRFGPPLALTAVISALSSRQDLDPGDGALGAVLPVVAHLVEYGLLFLLWRRALSVAPFAAVVTLLSGVGDEIHQSFVPGRDASGLDLAVDAAGIAAAAALLHLRASRVRWP